MKYKTELKIRIQSYGSKNHWSIQFWANTWWIFGRWVSYSSCGSSHKFNFTFNDKEKWEIVESLKKHLKHLNESE